MTMQELVQNAKNAFLSNIHSILLEFSYYQNNLEIYEFSNYKNDIQVLHLWRM